MLSRVVFGIIVWMKQLTRLGKARCPPSPLVKSQAGERSRYIRLWVVHGGIKPAFPFRVLIKSGKSWELRVRERGDSMNFVERCGHTFLVQCNYVDGLFWDSTLPSDCFLNNLWKKLQKIRQNQVDTLDAGFGPSNIYIYNQENSSEVVGLIFICLKHEFWLFDARILSQSKCGKQHRGCGWDDILIFTPRLAMTSFVFRRQICIFQKLFQTCP